MLFLVADDSFCDRAYRGRNPTSGRYNMSYFSNNYGYGKGKGFGQHQSYGSRSKGSKGKSRGKGGFRRSYFGQFGDQGERRGLC